MKKICSVLVMSLAIITMSCNRHETHGHHDHVDNLQLTSYNDDFEVFAEASPFAVGQESEILAHFTHLDNFKPLEEGSVTAKLIIGSDEVAQTLDSPTRPGIFTFSLKPEIAGEARLMFLVNTPDKTSQLTIGNITVFDDAHEALHAAHDAHITGINTAVFTKEQSWKVDFATEEVRREPFGQIIRAIGQIQPSLGDERVITARTGGIVLFPGNNVVEGTSVAAGQTLFSIDGSGMADNNLSVRFSEAQNEYNRARTEYERKAELAKDQIVSQSELLRARTELDNAQANYNNLQKNFSAGKQAVNSPIGGFIASVMVRNGEYAAPGQPVLTVSQNKNLFVKAELRPRYFDELTQISDVTFRQLQNKTTHTLDELGGRVVSFGKSADINNPLLPVVVQIDNRAGFVSGSFIEMFIKTQAQTEALTVSNEAIVEEMGNYFVYVQLTPELFEKRPVKINATNGIRTEITEGLSPGERVVGKGAILVKLAQSAAAIDPHAGHVH
ncbi:MAG: efflux RND transporter periplasmic adaptor subunit [Bacteroidia bacterium]|nr:efflux RND transporter periplasmic adaptor subunit [Bacteroidia bacterium]